ncbi:pseudoazurin [uncultured Sphingomonas sp.]|uniref:pseudoazurin n=1 Tax=Sphingomonas sp. TaxID=28214 RepID=UPI00260E411D|nr:pseudoazurin [uncultured Sphingomonas sp.]
MKLAYVAAALLALTATPALAKEFVVKMKNQGAAGAMVFEPAFVKAMPGDTVRFVPSDPSHNAETIPTMLPAGVAPSKGGMNKEFVLPVSTPGLYGIKCMPHYSMGMVALIQVGKGPSSNLAAARAVKLPPFAAKRMTPMLAQAK